MKQYDILLIGGGVIGLSIAFELSKTATRNGLRIGIMEKEQAGPSASWAAAGMIPPAPTKQLNDPIDKLKNISCNEWESWANEIEESSGVDVEYRKTGAIYLARSAGEIASIIGVEDFYQEQGVRTALLGVDELKLKLPNLNLVNSPNAKGLWLPDECQVRNSRLLKGLRAGCIQSGVEFNQSLDGQLEFSQSRVHSISNGGDKIRAEKFCICSGAWSESIARSLAVAMPVFPMRGQILLFRPENRNLIEPILNEGTRYIVGRKDGYVLVGSTEEETGFNNRTTESVRQMLLDFANALYPELNETNIVQHWSGLRPATLDGLPYLGRVHNLENCFVATGHFRNGIALSVGTAKLISKMLLDQPLDFDIQSLGIGRGIG